MKMKEQTLTSFLPLVFCHWWIVSLLEEGEMFDRYGVYHGEFCEKVICSTFYQKYHRHCVEISVESFNFGCHTT